MPTVRCISCNRFNWVEVCSLIKDVVSVKTSESYLNFTKINLLLTGCRVGVRCVIALLRRAVGIDFGL